ncbi:splicing factor 3B subunit 6-like protein [Pyrus communis]|uniref:splicing factor 3B subunit 6-like protein n=2 Tax=Pyrus TaxID=3766 RepID=UPI0035BFC074
MEEEKKKAKLGSPNLFTRVPNQTVLSVSKSPIFPRFPSLSRHPSTPQTATMSTISLRKVNTRLPPEVNRVLYVRNLPFNISSEEMYDIFGKYGAIRQIRIGTNKDTRGTAFVVYEDIYDAKTAVDHLSGFNVANRYLIVLYYQQAKMGKKSDTKKKEDEIARMQEKYGVSTKDK